MVRDPAERLIALHHISPLLCDFLWLSSAHRTHSNSFLCHLSPAYIHHLATLFHSGHIGLPLTLWKCQLSFTLWASHCCPLCRKHSSLDSPSYSWHLLPSQFSTQISPLFLKNPKKQNYHTIQLFHSWICTPWNVSQHTVEITAHPRLSQHYRQ
jgi:hypothetical protein